MFEKLIRVAACQLLSGEKVEENVSKVLNFIELCAEDNVDIVAFPEGCLFGYCCRPEYWEKMLPITFAKVESYIGDACKKYHINVIVGSASYQNGSWYNDLAIFDWSGELRYRYAKTFLAGEKWCVNNRGKLPIVRLAGVDCCFIICHDVRYPELVKLPAAMGAQICFFCSSESSLINEHKLSAYSAMPISRATENGIYLIMANTPANPIDMYSSGSSHGNSKIVDPDGNVGKEAGFFGDHIISETVDLSKAKGIVAKRTYSEETILRDWFQKGCEFVVRI